jgi:hypothetical protein
MIPFSIIHVPIGPVVLSVLFFHLLRDALSRQRLEAP